MIRVVHFSNDLLAGHQPLISIVLRPLNDFLYFNLGTFSWYSLYCLDLLDNGPNCVLSKIAFCATRG